MKLINKLTSGSGIQYKLCSIYLPTMAVYIWNCFIFFVCRGCFMGLEILLSDFKPTNSKINNAAFHIPGNWLLVTAFPSFILSLNCTQHPHSQVQRVNCTLVFKPPWLWCFGNLGPLSWHCCLCNVLADVSSANTMSHPEVPWKSRACFHYLLLGQHGLLHTF